MHPVLQKIGVRSAELLIVCLYIACVRDWMCTYTHACTHAHAHAHAHTHTHRTVEYFLCTLQVDLKADALSFIAAEVNVKSSYYSNSSVALHVLLVFTETAPTGE